MYSNVMAFTVTAEAMNSINAYIGNRISVFTATPTYFHHPTSSESGLQLRTFLQIPSRKRGVRLH